LTNGDPAFRCLRYAVFRRQLAEETFCPHSVPFHRHALFDVDTVDGRREAFGDVREHQTHAEPFGQLDRQADRSDRILAVG
jgi:hypothetical protein